MSIDQPNYPLHGITLEVIITRLSDHYGWERLGGLITINCFKKDPSIKSSLTFLRKTPWARKKVETLYLRTKFPKVEKRKRIKIKGEK
ncbi:VF530 family DNA-binding protein [Thermodesulfobacteriota bacterium]